jgi:hypothetical protein
MRVSWKALLASRTVQPHKTSKKEIESLRQLVAHDLTDAAIKGLSADRCFAIAYNAFAATVEDGNRLCRL